MITFTIGVDISEKQCQTKRREGKVGERQNKGIEDVRMHSTLSLTCFYLFVSLQLLNKGALVEEALQAFLSVVVAQVFKGCAALALSKPRVLKARCVHNEQRAHGVLAGFQSP